ncbi:MAG: DUF5675 family protein [Deltaproteobacteria bacterium]|jgi:hypothetical protein|nr:DUF5675 family protein [Deltaproteobacteria bacterium]
MQRLILTRKLQSDQGTFGRLASQGGPARPAGPGLSLHTGELPWRGNKQGISRIPVGIYRCVPYSSAKFPAVYHLLNVPGRETVLIHAGNFSGDKTKGFYSDVEGCILVGLSAGLLSGQLAVLHSREAMGKLRQSLGQSDFELEIVEAWQV